MSKPGCTPWLQDADVTLYHGDVLQVLRELPAESVDCCVTSPPYWGLRDYGTGAWDGGDPDCAHSVGGQVQDNKWEGAITTGQRPGADASRCRKCGATRIDQQLGLEPTPEEYVTRMVEVFREVRRVLAPHGTVWLNLGDSYASSPPGNTTKGVSAKSTLHGVNDESGRYRETLSQSVQTRRNTIVGDLKQKDLVGIPWMVAFALRQDGWYLRSDIIWAKPNPMPESVTDRPTKAHEYVFLLSKQPRYFFDQEAVREAAEWARWGAQNGAGKYAGEKSGAAMIQARTKMELQKKAEGSGRNIRSVWDIATQPYPEAHFATFPEELARRCIAAGTSERGKCPECGAPWVREVEKSIDNSRPLARQNIHDPEVTKAGQGTNARGSKTWGHYLRSDTKGWHPTCECWRPHNLMPNVPHPHTPVPAVVLDPFIGSGTVAHVARKLGRHAVGIDLNESYLELAARRLQQQSLFTETSGV